MLCLVTGAAGGIGSHLCERLISLGHEVHGLDDFSVGSFRAPYIKQWDISRERPMSFHVYDVIFHLAALADIVPSIEHPLRYHNANVTGTIRMLEYARWTRSKRFIYAASSSCYGDKPPTPTDESAPINCRYPYALTKYLGEQYVLHYAHTYGLAACSLRLFNVYGPRFRTRGTYGAVFGVFLAQLAQGAPLTVVGDGTQRRDFTFVDDVVDAFVAAAECGRPGEVYNIGTGSPKSVLELVEALGSPVTVHIPARPGEPDVTQAWALKADMELGWKPKVSFEAGVRRMLDHLPDYRTAPLWTPQKIESATRKWHEHLGGNQ